MRISSLARDVRGATAIEYGLIAGLIAIAIVPAIVTIAPKLNSTFNNVSSKLT